MSPRPHHGLRLLIRLAALCVFPAAAFLAAHPPAGRSGDAAAAAAAGSTRLLAAGGFRKARSLVEELVGESGCYSSERGTRAFAAACTLNVVYEDRFEPQPVVGRAAVERHLLDRVRQRQGRGTVRLDRVSDGDAACGFTWTWVAEREEGLRGTTFVELNDRGEIRYVQEIPEPIFKPGDLTKDLLRAITGDNVPAPASKEYTKQTPTVASDLVKYLFLDLQDAKDTDEMIRFFDDRVVYQDFNFEDVLRGPAQVRRFVEEFQFPGITFRPLRFDDGVDASCFTWELVLEGVDDTIKGVSFYELDPVSRKIVYVRDIPESAIKPPILGKLARQLRPGLGVFQGVPLGSRPGGV